MSVLELPWLDITISACVVGSLAVGRVRDPHRAARIGLGFTAAVFAFSVLAWLGFHTGADPDAIRAASLQPRLFGRDLLTLDDLSAPLVPAAALLHFLTALATTRVRMRRFSFAWSLASESILLAMFSCRASWLLVGLLSICTVPPYFELRNRRRPTRVYVVHMALFVTLLVLGWAGVEANLGGAPPIWAVVMLMAAILVRSGTVPAHCWVTDWFEHASFGVAILFVAPLAGVYAAVRLVLPIAPAWVLQGIGIASLFTAAYAAGMAAIQRDCQRMFANLFLSHASLVLVGLELHTEMSLTASLCLWFSVILSLGGFGLTMRALESRYGRLPLMNHLGIYEHSPTLAVCFLLTGLACVGFPGTVGFISAELLVDSAVEASPYVGFVVVAAAALNGIAVVRAYLILFTGAKHRSTIPLKIVERERFALLTLSALILGGGIFPQPGVTTRHEAAVAILKERREYVAPGAGEHDGAPPSAGPERRAGAAPGGIEPGLASPISGRPIPRAPEGVLPVSRSRSSNR
ncbi:proton-conducting transporter transmembrane domain-containing protein [Aquisphaera insulae]|uniref:proton-conducting transporter transmembrane domain-containing protein n=1 Tax=Aquisphaera insulae TaxID=2712864 RepID=UPI0013EC5829|nr:proton-conducting transporter membrane subunit [Aquisphaera insulae]